MVRNSAGHDPINGKKVRDCTDDECQLLVEFYYKLR